MTSTERASRVSADDLEWAATWLLAYNDGEEETEAGFDEMVAVARKVATWLEAEADRRRDEATVRKLVRDNPGATRRQARAAIRKVRTERATK